jgi:hypothetical protein
MITTFNAINKVKAFNPNIIEDDVMQICKEVEEFELKKLLGNRMLVDIINNEDDYINVIEPFEYQYGGYTYSHQGLTYVIAYLVHEQHLLSGKFKETNSGYILHKNEFSDRIGDKDSQNLAKRLRSIALTEWEEISAYLNRFSSQYPLWCSDQPMSINKMRINKI